METLNTVLDIVLIIGIIAYWYASHKHKIFILKTYKDLNSIIKNQDKTFSKSYCTSLKIIMLYYAEREMYKEAEEVQKIFNEMQIDKHDE